MPHFGWPPFGRAITYSRHFNPRDTAGLLGRDPMSLLHSDTRNLLRVNSVHFANGRSWCAPCSPYFPYWHTCRLKHEKTLRTTPAMGAGMPTACGLWRNRRSSPFKNELTTATREERPILLKFRSKPV